MSKLYVPLWCKSNFSFLEGASHPDEIVEQVHEIGLRALAITDRDGVYGVVRAHASAKTLGLKLIIGAEVTAMDGSAIVLLSQDRRGYANLCQLLTKGRLREQKGESRVEWSEICAHAQGLIALWGGARSLIISEQPPSVVGSNLKDAFGSRLYAVAARHHRAIEVAQEARLRTFARKIDVSIVAANEVLYHWSSRRRLQDILTCIRNGVTLFSAGTRTKANGGHALAFPALFNALFEDDPAAVRRTEEVAEQCSFSLDEIRYRYPSERLPDGSSSEEWLRRITFEGALKRYPQGIPAKVADQLNRELSLIEELEYCGYFLTMHEIVCFCRDSDILCQGRGSAANSAVCYCLGITAVDPVSMGLLFERFLSRERAEPPDIDLDIEHARREEVIQHVYDKYGRDRAAMVAVIIRYRTKSAIRDVGKVLGLPETSLDRLAKLFSHHDTFDPKVMRDAGLSSSRSLHTQLIELVEEIRDFPRHLSIHPGGFLLGSEPIQTLVPIENATMQDRTVIQWDKDDLETLGLFKVDLLGLGALNVVHRAFDLIEAHRGQALTLAGIPTDDEPTYDMICRSETVGVFQIESRAQMAMLPRLRPRTYYDLVIEVSIVRPGPITGGMVHPYLRRRNGEEAVEYPHESLEPVLRKTLGVPLFQEQVMRLAVVAADYTPGEADQLRRDMAAWRSRGRIERHHERLVSRMMAKGIAQEFAERVFDQIKGFGEYGFPESHAASFALIAYATAWLRCHFPAEFLCALLNAQPMGFYTPSTLIDDARRNNVEVRPVDVLFSKWDCTMEPATSSPGKGGFAVRMGLRYVKGLGEAEGQRILRAHFSDLETFVRGTRLDERRLSNLAEAGAFECFGLERRSALWALKRFARTPATALPLQHNETLPLFTPLDATETIAWDYRASNHSSRGHPLSTFREALKRQSLPDAQSIARMADGERIRYAGLVICRQRPGTASGVTFMTLEDETGFVNLVLWQKVFEAYAVIAKSQSFLGVTGRIQADKRVVHLIADALWVPEVTAAPDDVRSRDFH